MDLARSRLLFAFLAGIGVFAVRRLLLFSIGSAPLLEAPRLATAVVWGSDAALLRPFPSSIVTAAILRALVPAGIKADRKLVPTLIVLRIRLTASLFAVISDRSGGAARILAVSFGRLRRDCLSRCRRFVGLGRSMTAISQRQANYDYGPAACAAA